MFRMLSAPRLSVLTYFNKSCLIKCIFVLQSTSISFFFFFLHIHPLSPPLQSTRVWFTHYVTHSSGLVAANPINVSPRFKQRNDIRLYLCYAASALFPFILSLSLSNFLQDLENALASFHAAILNQPPPPLPAPLLHHGLLWGPLIFLIS